MARRNQLSAAWPNRIAGIGTLDSRNMGLRWVSWTRTAGDATALGAEGRHSGRTAHCKLVPIKAASQPGLLRFRPLRQVLVYWLPWPKGRIATAPEMLTTAPSAWDYDVAQLHALIEQFAARSPSEAWAGHPAFGPLSGREWGVLCWKHLDHHLRQFGA